MQKMMLVFFSLLSFISMVSFNNKHRKHNVKAEEVQYDGPYVQYNHDKIYVKYIMDTGTKSVRTDSISLLQKDSLSLKVSTDIPGKFFEVRLKKKLQNEPSEFRKVKNMVVLSDIEGNFAAFRKLLLATKVIDENLDWKFGDGQLVLVGDFFDRGLQVTEVLWFIYYLEEKAQAAGGYVHFILGNHEIMNLTGDLRYLQQKYFDDAALLNQNYITLYDKNSELGKWLRTKNITEKIGDIMFAHGGISGIVDMMNISVADINKLARPYYDDTTYKYNDPKTDILYSDLGPFWYRGYYMNRNRETEYQVDSALNQFNVKHIITGHTIVADTISVWYRGKLLNTDVHHAAGKSEALVIEENKFYRVNAEGNKVLLMEHKRLRN